MSTAPVTLTIEEPQQASPMPSFAPRLVLRAHPETLTTLAGIIEALPIAGSPAASFGPALGLAADMLTGGCAIMPDPGLPVGAWTLTADGRHIASGTVIT